MLARSVSPYTEWCIVGTVLFNHHLSAVTTKRILSFPTIKTFLIEKSGKKYQFKMTSNKVSDLTEQETELYDRQIRLWGLESQKRIRTSSILICGLNGLGAEVAKNIILSGVKVVTLLDHRNVSELDYCSQFLTPHDSVGTNRAEASRKRAQALNQMVEINIDKDNVSDKADDFFYRFDVVILIEAPTATLVRVNNTCRLQGIKFFAGDVWGMHGFSFNDLQEHEFAE